MVGQRGGAEETRGGGIDGIKRMFGEGEGGAEDGVDEVGGEEIEGNDPTGEASSGGERLNDYPPKKEGGEDKGGVFDLMPERGTEGEIEGGGDVPSAETDGESEPAEDRVGESGKYPMEEGIGEERSEDIVSEASGESAEDGKIRGTEKDERWSDRKKEKVLDHVGGEEEPRESVEWGEQSDGDGEEPREEGEETSGGEAIWGGMTKNPPASEIEEGVNQ